MELNPKQQIIELVRQSQRILLLTHANPDGDALGSIMSLFLALKKIGKEPMAVCPTYAPKVFQFLPQLLELKDNFNGSKDFIISIDTAQANIDKIGYKNVLEEKKLNIVITPKSGTITSELVSFSQGGFKFDLIIVLDCSDLERLGEIYDKNSDLFYETALINIDHHAGNDHFGKVNWVDITATSTSEILVALLESLGRDKPLLDADIATCLLTGIITDTGSFQNSNTTPKSFTVAAQLVAAGARQQEIIREIFKTKSLSTLKLWGKVLSNIHEEKDSRFIWSKICKEDFMQSGASEDEASGVVDELLKTAPDIDFALLLSERKDGVHGNLRGVLKGVNVAEIAAIFGGGGHELAAGFHMFNATLSATQIDIIGKIKDFQSKRLNIAVPSNSMLEDIGQADSKNQTDQSSDVDSSTLQMPPLI